MIENEIMILRIVRHPNIMTVHEVFQEKDSVILICEFIEGQDLYEHLRQKIRLEEKEAASIIK